MRKLSVMPKLVNQADISFKFGVGQKEKPPFYFRFERVMKEIYFIGSMTLVYHIIYWTKSIRNEH